MKIVSIFADQLFSFRYPGEADNEYDRLMELWTDISYLKDFAQKNNIADVEAFAKEILHGAEQIQDFLENINQNQERYDFYFESLQLSEDNKPLAFQKGKIKWNKLRYYAIKLDANCFVITGGAIKMSQTMQEHPATNYELAKLKAAKAFLNENGVIDEDSFYELLTEQQ